MLIIYALFLIFLIIFTIFFISQAYNYFFKKLPVFISTNQKAINDIVKNLDISPNATVYELGCGKANFLNQVREKYPKANLVGIEYSLAPYLLSLAKNVIKKNKIKIIKQNFFKIDLKNIDVIYCYLGCDIMKQLENKFKKECKKDTLIISYQFKLPNVKSFKVIDIDKKAKAYFYKI